MKNWFLAFLITLRSNQLWKTFKFCLKLVSGCCFSRKLFSQMFWSLLFRAVFHPGSCRVASDGFYGTQHSWAWVPQYLPSHETCRCNYICLYHFLMAALLIKLPLVRDLLISMAVSAHTDTRAPTGPFQPQREGKLISLSELKLFWSCCWEWGLWDCSVMAQDSPSPFTLLSPPYFALWIQVPQTDPWCSNWPHSAQLGNK